MNPQNVLDRDLIRGAHRVDRPAHRLDVVEHLGGGDIAGLVTQAGGELGLEQAAATDLQPLDPRGCDRFCT